MAKKVEEIRIESLKIEHRQITIVGDTPLIVHAWSEKVKKEMLEKQMKKTKTTGKAIRDPFAEFMNALYWITEKPEEDTEEATTEEVTEASVPEGYEDPEMVSTGTPVIKLTTHEVHIEAGGDFYTMDYVEDAVDDKDTKEYLYDNMFLDSVYDKSKKGTYELIYFCVDSDGNRSNSAKLKLYVE